MLSLINRKSILAAVLLSSIFCLSLLIGPRISDEQADASCLRNFHFGSHLGFSLNCDSPGFILAAIDPATLLEKDNVRQSRPGLIYLAHVISLPINSALSLLKRGDADSLHGNEYPLYVKSVFFDWFPVYISYEILHFLTLLLAVLLFVNISRRVFPQNQIALPIGMLLVFNDVVKAYFWSPHTQMFNLLLPMIFIWGFLGVLREGWLRNGKIFAVSAAVGLGVLAYPSFTLFVLALLAPLPWARDRQPWPALLPRLAGAIILCLGPSLLWWAYVKMTVGSYYQHEVVRYHQVVWIFETLQQGIGSLIRLLAEYAWTYLGFAFWHALPIFGLMLLSGGVLQLSRGKTPSPDASEGFKAVALAGLFSTVLSFAFLTALGYTAPRLAYMMIPGLLLLAALVAGLAENRLQGRTQNGFRWLTTAICLGVGILEVWKNSPLN
jgi:hypothetical protein